MSQPTALVLNTANLLGPAMLLVALILLGVAAWGDWSPEEDRFWVTSAGILIAAALIIRISWGIAIAIIRRRKKQDSKRKAEG